MQYITVCNGDVRRVQLIHNILNHEKHLNNMYSFRVTQRIGNFYYKNKTLKTV